MAKPQYTEQELTHLLQLARQLDSAKAAEGEAKLSRIKIETMIENAVDCPEEGQVTVQLPNGSSTCVKRSLNRKADTDKINDMFDALNAFAADDEKMFAPLKTTSKIELDKNGLEWYRINKPEIYKQILQHIVTKPAKTSVTRK
jgi:hypothetical protein